VAGANYSRNPAVAPYTPRVQRVLRSVTRTGDVTAIIACIIAKRLKAQSHYKSHMGTSWPRRHACAPLHLALFVCQTRPHACRDLANPTATYTNAPLFQPVGMAQFMRDAVRNSCWSSMPRRARLPCLDAPQRDKLSSKCVLCQAAMAIGMHKHDGSSKSSPAARRETGIGLMSYHVLSTSKATPMQYHTQRTFQRLHMLTGHA